MYFSELILDRLINISSMRNKAVCDFTLIIITVPRFVGTGCFVIIFPNSRTNYISWQSYEINITPIKGVPRLFVTKYCPPIFLTIKPTRCTNFSIYFWNETLHVSNSSSVHYHEIFTVNTAIVYVILVMLIACEQEQMLLLTSCQHNLYDIYHCCVYSEKIMMVDRLTIQNM